VRATPRAETDAFADFLYDDRDFEVVDAAEAVAARLGVPTAQVALAWLLQRPGVTAPIIGATKLAHLHDAVAATELTLDPADVAALEAPYVPHRVLGH
jgi:aryl-alcohol dehydrogenase-like predicted oxidoreductase